MEEDGLPSQVCLQCVHYINRAFSFKQLCERSDATLRQYLGKPLLTEVATKEIIPIVPVQILEASSEPVTQIILPLEVEGPSLHPKNEVIEPKIEILDGDGAHSKWGYIKFELNAY